MIFLCQPPAFAHHPGTAPIYTSKGETAEGITAQSMLNSESAGTLGKNRASAGFAFSYVNFDQIPPKTAHSLHHRGREVHGKKHEEFYTLGLAYGVLEDLDLQLTAPIVSKASNQIDDHAALGDNERATGFGDMRLAGKYRFWKKDLEAAVIAGVKFPTGKTSVEDRTGAKFDPEQQPGSGSWDADFGLAVSRSFKRRISASAAFQYLLRTQGGQQYEAGDLFRFDIGAAAALRPLGEYPNVSAHLEFNHEWARKDRESGLKTFDSGGTAVSITPGLSASLNRNLSAFCALSIPISQNLGGAHEETGYRVLAGVSLSV